MIRTISPGVILAIVVVLVATQVTRVLMPSRGAYIWALVVSIVGLVVAEMIATSSSLGGPALGVLHPLCDAVVIGALQVLVAYALTPRRVSSDP